MLERIEESADLVIVLKKAVEHYFEYLQHRVAECTQAIEGLPERQNELGALLDQGNRAELEIEALQKQRELIKEELEPLRPYLTIVERIASLEVTIREREKEIEEESTIGQRETENIEARRGDFAKEEARSAAATREHKRLKLQLEVGRLTVDRDYQLRRLKELKIDREVIAKKERDIQLRVRKTSDLIEEKRKAVDTISRSIAHHKEAIESAKPADLKLREVERDLEYLGSVIEIVGGVSLDAEALLERATEPAST